MQDREQARTQGLNRGKGLTSGLSLEDKDSGHTCATKDTSLLHNGGLNDGQ